MCSFFLSRHSKKSFFIIYSEISKKEQRNSKISKEMDNLQDNFKYSNEEILLQNLYFKGINIVIYYNFISAFLISTIFFIGIISSKLPHVELFLLPTIIMYLLVFL